MDSLSLPTLDTFTPITRRDGREALCQLAFLGGVLPQLRAELQLSLPGYHGQGQAKYRQRRTVTLILFYPPHCFCCFVKNAQTKLNVGVSGEHLRLSLLSSEETNCTCVQKHQNDLVITKKKVFYFNSFLFMKYLCSVLSLFCITERLEYY